MLLDSNPRIVYFISSINLSYCTDKLSNFSSAKEELSYLAMIIKKHLTFWVCPHFIYYGRSLMLKHFKYDDVADLFDQK